jgi:hypothetical protein
MTRKLFHRRGYSRNVEGNVSKAYESRPPYFVRRLQITSEKHRDVALLGFDSRTVFDHTMGGGCELGVEVSTLSSTGTAGGEQGIFPAVRFKRPKIPRKVNGRGGQKRHVGPGGPKKQK